MPKQNGALDEFAEDFPVEDPSVDPFEVGVEKAPEKEVVVEEEGEKTEPRKNRQHRRLETKLQQERETNIELNARLKALSEERQFRQEVRQEDTDVSRIYGTDTPEAREATRLLQSALQRTREEAETSALQKFEAVQETQRKAQRDAEGLIDSELESLEDEFDVDLTSDAPAARKARRELLELVSELSPKDSEGNIKDYADFGKAFEIYQNTKEKPNANRQKDLAARSMVKSGASSSTKLETDAQESYLKSIGVI